MRRVLGLDISKTNTGWAVGDGGKPIVGVQKFGKPGAVLYDVKCILPRDAVDARL